MTTTIFASGLIEKSFRSLNKEFGKKTEKTLRNILKSNKKNSQVQELNTFLVLMSQTDNSVSKDAIVDVEKNSLFKLFKWYNDVNIEKYLKRRLKKDKELKETSEIVLDFLNEINGSYRKSFSEKITKLDIDLPKMLNEISVRTFMSLWDLDDQHKYRFYFNGFDDPDKMLFEFDKADFQENFDLLEHFDEFIILNFFLAFMERSINKFKDLINVLEHLEKILPNSLLRTSNINLQTKANLFFRILTAKLSALQELDHLMFRILNLYEASKLVLQPLNLVSVNFIELNNIMDLIESDVSKGKDMLFEIGEKITSCQKLLRDYNENEVDTSKEDLLLIYLSNQKS